MPSQQQVKWSQLKVGVLVIVALSALAALVFLMSGSTGGFLTGKLTVVSYFENSAGLKVGALTVVSTHAEIDQPRRNGKPASRSDIPAMIAKFDQAAAPLAA